MPESVRRILVVDDDEIVLGVLRNVLDDMGLEVTEALTGKSAHDLLIREKFDVVISDKNLPDANGLEILRQAKAVDPKVGTLLITGFSSRQSAEEALAIGLDDYLYKPFDLQDLRKQVEEALERRDLQSAVGKVSLPHPLRMKVLVCDPDENSRKDLTGGIRMLGHQAEESDSLEEATTTVAAGDIQFLVCDLDMLKKDNIMARVLRKKLAQTSGVRLVTVAAGRDTDDIVAGIRYGSDKMLYRPLESQAEVANRLREYLVMDRPETDTQLTLNALIARRNIPSGTELTEKMLDSTFISAKMKSFYVVSTDDRNRVVGKRLEVARMEGDLILWSCFW